MNEIRFDEDGLIPVVVQEIDSKEVLMVAYMNQEALEKTVSSRVTWFFSRSRQQLWQKGETSGNIQQVMDIRYDCDGDAVLVLVKAMGPACHTGHNSCFYRNIEGQELDSPLFNPEEVYGSTGPGIMYELMKVIRSRYQKRPEGSYTTYLFNEGIDKILKKVGEETAEVIIAAKNPGNDELIYEASDLMYHLMVLLVEKNISLGQVFQELKSRR